MRNPSTYIKIGKILFAFFLIIGSFGTYAQDNDLDGILNLADLDDDNDGILDAIEGCRDTDIAGTIGIGNTVVNATYNLEGTDVTYTLNNPDNANIYGFDAGLQGMAIRLEGAAGNTGSLTSDYSTPIAYVGFKMTDFDNDTRATIEVYDENNVLYDLTLDGVLSVGSAITQTGNLFVADATDIDGDDPADDPITSILFYFESQVSRIVINFEYPSSSTTRFTQPVFCSLDSDADGIINIFDLDSDNDGIYDAVEASHAQPHTNGMVNGAVGSDGIPDTVQAAPNDGMVNYSVAENSNDVDTIYDFLDLDTDGDGCFDVIEAGHIDQDTNGILGTSPVIVDSDGLVISDANGTLNNGTDSYTGTNIGVTTVGQAFTIDTNPQDQSISNGDDATFTVAVSISGLTFLWEESSDNGSTFDPVTDGGRYSGSTTESLTISNVNNGMNGNQYRVTVLDSNNICSFIQSTIASLYTRPTITINDTSANEGSNMTFTITASDAVSQNINYTISYTNNTTTTADYSGPTTVTMASGSTSVTFNVLAIDDDWVEQTQQDFTATISTNSNQVIISDDEGVGTIVDTDIAYVVGGNFDIEEGEVIQYRLFLSTDTNSGGQQYVGTEDAYIVDFATEINAGSPSPATDGSDFNSFSTTATFPAGSIAGTEIFIAVPTTEDTLVEPSEEFNGVKSRNSAEATKYGSGPSRVSINTERSSLRIHDDDTATITLEDISVNEDVGTTNYTFTLAGQTRDAFDISYQTNNNTADSATDYTNATSTVSFNGTDGEARSILLSITDDLILESTEDFTIVPSYTGVIPSLANAVAQNVVFANNPGTVTIIDNDLEAVDDYTTVYHAQVIKTIDVLSNDNFGNSGPAATNALQIVTTPSNGTISINDNGTPADPSDDVVNYDPTPTYTGPDSFTYSITNSLGTSDTATVFINVSDAEVRAAFTIRYQGEIKGDMTTIANNVLSRHPSNAYNGTGDNNDFTDNVFVDIDSDPTTFNSTNANFGNLGLPCQNIVGAYLYWAAANNEYDFQNGNGQPEPVWNFEDVKLMLPGQTSYTTVTADEVIFNGRATDFENNPYICIKDITADVNALADPFGTYQLGNVKATEGTLQYDDGIAGVAGGWQIVFVYESGSLNTRNITLYDGYAHVSSLIGSTDFDFYGFETIPVGNVNASVLLGSLEGDRNLTGDQFLIRDTSANWTNISSGLRLADNYFNSKITIGGSDYIDRNPASTNTLGYDVSLFDLNNTGNSLIGNNQTDTSLRITSSGDTYGVYLMGMSVEVYEPSLGALSLSPIAGTYNPGDIIPMVLDVNNTGNDNVLGLTINTILPNDVDFIDATPLPPGVTYTFDTLTRALEFQVEDGYTDIGDAYNLEFNLQVKDQCYYLETTCGSSFQFQATATFTGEISGNTFTTDSSGTTDTCGIGQNDPTIININEPNQVNWSTAVGALNSTVSCDDTNALNTAQTLEPVTEFCNFTLTKTSGIFVAATPGCNSVGTYTNTWVFTDACGRTSQPFTQVISINDSTAPTFIGVLPVDTIAAYDNIPNAEVLNASDTCDTNAQVNMVETYIGDNSSTTYTIIRTWTASDCAGNTTEHVQNIYVTENGEQIGLTINDISVDEGAGTATFTVTLTGTTTANFTVDYSGIDNTAIASADFNVTSSALSFNGNHGETQNIVVTINDDNILEITETYYIELSNLSTNEISIIDNTGLGTITDNDGSGAGDGISVADFTVIENVGTVDFVITYTGPTVANAFTVDFAVADGAAISPSDYSVVSATGNVSFPANTISGTTQIVTVTIIDDSLIEADEDLSITLSNISNSLVAMLDANGLGTITDNDGVIGTGLEFDVLNVTVNEGDGTATFNVTLTGNVPGGFIVDFATSNDSADEPNDYISNANTLTFNGTDGETYPIIITIIDDNLLEVTEQFFLNLSNISTTLVGINTPQATGTITDNDGGVAGDGISVADFTVNENVGTVDFDVTYTGPTVVDAFTVDFVVVDGMAVSPNDYTVTAATGNVSFPASTTNGTTQVVTVTIIDDVILETAEDLNITLSNISTPLVAMIDADGIGTITDNETQPDNDNDTIPDYVDMDDDNDGIPDIEECLGENPTMLTYTSRSGMNISNVDYGISVTSTGQPIIGANGNGIALEEDAPGYEFTFSEPVGRLSLSFGNVHSNNEIGDFQLTLYDGTIIANADFILTHDPAEDPYDYNGRETGGDPNWAVRLVRRVGAPYPVGVHYLDRGTGTGQSWGIVVFEGYELNPIVRFSYSQHTGPDLGYSMGIGALRPVDCDTDGDGVLNQFDLDSDNDGIFDAVEVGHAAAHTNGEVNGAVGVDGIPDVVQATADDREYNYTFSESADDIDTIYDFLDLDSDGDGIPDNVEAQTTIGYVSPAGTVDVNGVDTNFTSGLVPTNTDGTDNPDYLDTDSDNEGGGDTSEANITLGGTDSDNDGLDDATDATSDYTDVGGTIDNPLSTPLVLPDSDNDANTGGDVDFRDGNYGISFQNDDITVDEAAGTATVNLLLTGNVPGGFTIDFTSTDNTAIAPDDYTTNSGQLTFAGTDSETQPITIIIIDDNLIEATERLLIDLSNLSTTLISINDAQANINITDNDGGGAGDGISVADFTVNENINTVDFEITYTGPTAADAFTVDFAVADGTAISPDDYTVAAATGNVSFPSNTTTGTTQVVTVTIVDDALLETSEDLNITLSNISNPLIAMVDADGVGTITDNDGGGAGDGISVADFTVNENINSVDFEITYTGPTVADAFTVDFVVVDGTAISPDDYTVASATGNVSFPSNTTTGTTQTITVTIIDDTLLEGAEDLNITLSNISNPLVAMVDADGVGTITDNDGGGAGDGISVADFIVNENIGTVDFVITYTGPTAADAFTVNFAVADGTAISPDDYTVATATGNVSFPANTATGTTQVVTVTIIDDTLLEGAEDLNITLSNISNPLVAMVDADGVGTITDNDGGGAGDGISVADFIVNENIGTVDFVITYTGPTAADAFTVNFAVADGTAISPDDYTVATATGNVSFPANTATGTTQVVTVTIVDDALLETSEDLNITLSNISNPLIAMVDADGIGTITDNDGGGAGDGISVADFIVNENIGTVDFVITYTGPTAADAFTVDFAVADGTAISPDDYTVATATGNVSFPANTATGTTQTVTVTIVNDAIIESTEELNITLSNISYVSIALVDGDGIGVITDDDIDLDADDDGLLDSFEDLNTDGDNDPATNPTNSDNDAYPDYLDIDSDDDGIPDNVEAQTTSGYIPPSLIDANGNGVDDAYETGTEIGIIPVNTDGEDLPDYLDDDSDNDNVPDNIEAHDYNQDGVADVVLIGSDKDNDGLDDSFEGTDQIDIDINDEIDDPINDLPNTDGDDESDYRDLDDDNDGIPTIDEDTDEDMDYSNDDWDNDGIPDYLDPDQEEEIDDVEIFNVVTPNNDMVHDFLMITGLELRPDNNLKIYNRWGILVYSTASYNTEGNVFDGTSQARVTVGKDDRLPVGTYFYLFDYVEVTGERVNLSGHLYLN